MFVGYLHLWVVFETTEKRFCSVCESFTKFSSTYMMCALYLTSRLIGRNLKGFILNSINQHWINLSQDTNGSDPSQQNVLLCS